MRRIFNPGLREGRVPRGGPTEGAGDRQVGQAAGPPRDVTTAEGAGPGCHVSRGHTSGRSGQQLPGPRPRAAQGRALRKAPSASCLGEEERRVTAGKVRGFPDKPGNPTTSG